MDVEGAGQKLQKKDEKNEEKAPIERQNSLCLLKRIKFELDVR